MRQFLLFIFILTATTVQSQVILEKEFQSPIGLLGIRAIQLPDGDFFITANAYPPTYDSSLALLIKTDSLMQPVWTRRYKLLHQDQFVTITPSMDGNFFLGGSGRESFNQQSGGSLYKIDSSGAIVWHWIYSDTYDDAVIKVFEQADSTLMIFIREGVSNHPTKIVHAAKDGALISQWYFNIGAYNLEAEGIASDGAGNFFMSGTITFGVGLPVIFMVSLNQSTLNWYKEYSFGRTVTNTAIEKLTDGNFVLSGSIADSAFPTTYNALLLKVDATGNILWAREIQQPLAYNEFGNSAGVLPNGEICLAGHSPTANGFKAFACRLDGAGNILWSGTYGDYPYQDFTSVTPLSDGRLLFMGFTNTSRKLYLTLADSSGISPCSYLPFTLVTTNTLPVISTQAITSSLPTINPISPAVAAFPETVTDSIFCIGQSGIDELFNGYQGYVYPNPTNGPFSVVLKTTQSDHVRLRLMNQLGGVAWQGEVDLLTGENRLFIDAKQEQAGLYFLSINGKTTHAYLKVVLSSGF